MRNITIYLQNSETLKIQLTISINFISSKDAEEEPVMHSTSNNIKFTSCNDANEVVNELFDSLCARYQRNLETSMRVSDFTFESVQLMHYKCHKVKFRRGGSYIDSPDWMKKEKSNNKSEKYWWRYFQYTATVALNHEEIKWNTETFSNIKRFIN